MDNKKRKLDVTSPQCVRTDELFTSDICQIHTPIKVADFKEEYQVAEFQEEYTKHNDSFTSCTSETDVNNAQAYESARRTVSDIPTQDSGDSVAVDYTEQKVTSINQDKYTPVSNSNHDDFKCPCCNSPMSKTHRVKLGKFGQVFKKTHVGQS